jgi:hypothetical protein
MDDGTMQAAAAPSSTRPPMSAVTSGAAAHARDSRANAASDPT